MDLDNIKAFQGLLVGFTREQVQVKCYILPKTVFGTEESTRTVKVRYLIINTTSLYNMIIGRPSFNLIRDTMSILYMCMMYPQSARKIEVIQRDQDTARRCYYIF